MISPPICDAFNVSSAGTDSPVITDVPSEEPGSPSGPTVTDHPGTSGGNSNEPISESLIICCIFCVCFANTTFLHETSFICQMNIHTHNCLQDIFR